MYVGNIMLLVLNLPLVGLFARIAAIRPQIIVPVISILCLFGIYSVRNSIFDVWIMIFSGIAGFFLRRRNFPLAPFIIGIVLGPTTENSFRQTLMLLKGDLSLIAYRPIAAALLATALLFILFKLLSFFWGRKIDLKIKEPV